MKRSVRFFVIVAAMLLASSAGLTGCIYSISKDHGEPKPYSAEGHISKDDVFGEADAPSAQREMQEKFRSMYEISEDGNSITVISKDFLNEYWKSNYEKEVIHSLSTEEVYFIIQDSVRVYIQYEKVILVGFGSISSNKQVAERFPYLDGAELTSRSEKSSFDRDDREKAESDIHKIIMYRLGALSSPKAFFTGEEAIRFVGGDPKAYDGMYPESVFYIPGYSSNTDRDYILSIMGGSSDFTDLERYTDLFEVSSWGGAEINFLSKANGTITEVFPTAEMRSSHRAYYTTTPGANDGEGGPCFLIQPSESFILSHGIPISIAIWGSVEKQSGKLILLPYYDKSSEDEPEHKYVFYPIEDTGYRYSKAESKPVIGYDFDDGTIFYSDEPK